MKISFEARSPLGFEHRHLPFFLSLSLSVFIGIYRRIKVSFPSDVRRTQIEDIAALAPGQQVAIPLEIVLAGLGGKRECAESEAKLNFPELWNALDTCCK